MISIQEFSKDYKGVDYEDVYDKYQEYFRENAQVGDGATVHLYTDRYACTIIKRTPKSLTLRRCKATLDPSFKPEFIPGGFSAICINSSEQKWNYEEDDKGVIYRAFWSERKKGFFSQGLRVTPGRYEHYDYNF